MVWIGLLVSKNLKIMQTLCENMLEHFCTITLVVDTIYLNWNVDDNTNRYWCAVLLQIMVMPFSDWMHQVYHHCPASVWLKRRRGKLPLALKFEQSDTNLQNLLDWWILLDIFAIFAAVREGHATNATGLLEPLIWNYLDVSQFQAFNIFTTEQGKASFFSNVNLI